MKQNRKNSPEKSKNNNKKVDYNDFAILKKSFIEMGAKYKKIKEENDMNLKLLKEYKNQVSEFNKTKTNITIMLKKIQEKFKQIKEKEKTDKENEEAKTKENQADKEYKEELLKKRISELESEINIKKEENVRNNEIKKELEEKIKNLENEIKINKEEMKNKENIIENMNVMEKAYNENIKEKENELYERTNELNQLKEKYNNEREDLLKQISTKEEEIKKEEDIINDEKLNNTKLQKKIINLEIEKRKINRINNKFDWNKFNCINYEIRINFNGIIKDNNTTPKKTNSDEIKNKNYVLKEEKNAFITLSRVTETNISTNKYDLIKNMNSSNNTNSKNINEVLISNYLNTINIGYNGLSEINKNIDFEGEDNNTKDQTKLELEPTPSFILCLQKTNNL